MMWECLIRWHCKWRGKRLKTADSAQRNNLKYLGITSHIINYSRIQLLQIYGNITEDTFNFIHQSTAHRVTSFELLVVFISSQFISCHLTM